MCPEEVRATPDESLTVPNLSDDEPIKIPIGHHNFSYTRSVPATIGTWKIIRGCLLSHVNLERWSFPFITLIIYKVYKNICLAKKSNIKLKSEDQ